MSRMVERVCRVLGVLALAVASALAVWRAIAPASANAARPIPIRLDAAVADSTVRIARALASRITAGTDTTFVSRVVVADLPSAEVRRVLAAARSGTRLSWIDSTGLRDFAATTAAAVSPRAATELTSGVVLGATPAAGALVLQDAGGVLDSVAIDSRTPARALLSVRAARLEAPVTAEVRVGDRKIGRAVLTKPDTHTLRHVLLYARPGWEAKFVMVALEESGWTVDATWALSPRTEVRAGAPSVPDTSRHAAVIVLDSGMVGERSLARFVAQGGGVLIAGDAVRDPALVALTGARSEARRAPLAGALLTDTPRRGLAAWPVVPAGDAVILERDGPRALVSVVRRGPGRVLATGYVDTWHWRMEGPDDGADAHRRWWNALVGAVAAAADSGRATNTAPGPGDAAPYADLRAQLGDPAAMATSSTRGAARRELPPWLLFVIGGTALVMEWALRRFRGAP